MPTSTLLLAPMLGKKSLAARVAMTTRMKSCLAGGRFGRSLPEALVSSSLSDRFLSRWCRSLAALPESGGGVAGGGRGKAPTPPRFTPVLAAAAATAVACPSAPRGIIGGARGLSSSPVLSSEIGDGRSGQDFSVVQDGENTYLIASHNLEAGRAVFDRVRGSLSGERTRHSIQVREGLHLETKNDVIFMNHSCEPNCQLEVVTPPRDEGRPYLRVTVSAPEIRRQEPLTIDYNAMEIDMSCPFDCLCGTDQCKGRISGFANLPPFAQMEYVAGRWAAATAAAAATTKTPAGPAPLTGAVRAWAQENVESSTPHEQQQQR